MKKNKIGLIVIIAIILIILVSIIAILNNKKPVLVEQETTSTSIKIKEVINQYENSSKSIKTIIPEFQNLDDDFERTINYKIHKDLDELEVYKIATEGFDEDEIEFFTYETSYNRYNCGNYVSIVAEQYINIGLGRPRIQKKCYVINSANSSSVRLVDIFENKINYKKKILEEISKQAEKQDIELMGGNGLKELDDEQAFYIKDNKLIIYFESSEIAAAAVGELEFEMPFEMKDNKFIF